MTTAVSSNVESVGFDARQAAKAEARRAGMTLGEWLDSVIAERAAESGLTPEEIDESERIEAVAARLATLSKQAEQNAYRDRRQSDGVSREAARAPAKTAVAGSARPGCSEVDRPARPPIDPERVLDQAIAARNRRARFANDITSAALATVSQRLAGIEDRLEQRKELKSRSPAKEAPSRDAAPVEENDGRLERADAKTAAGARSEHLARIEAKLNRLSATISRVTQSQPRRDSHRAPLSRRLVADAVAEITQHQAALDQAPSPGEPDRLSNLKADLAALAARLEEMRSDIVTHDEQQFRAIGEKIEAVAAAHADAAALARIHSQTEEIRDLLAAAVAHPRPIETIEGKIEALAERVEAVATRGPSPATFAQCDSKLAEIRAALAHPIADPLLEQIERRIESLTHKVEEALSNSSGSEHFDELRQRLDFIHQSLAARIERPAPALDTKPFEAMMRKIVAKLDQVPTPADAAPQLENLISRLTDRLEAPADTRRLEQLLTDLAAKVDLLAKPPADLPALHALQDRIEQLAQRLDDADANADVLASLERSIADLLSGLEETRQAAIEAAETAARTAARDAMREVALAAAGSRPAADEQAGDVTRELADLRALQDAADRQTHATLTAVHETLEKVVDRLAMLEDDIIDVRAAATEHSSAAEPPLFMSLPRHGSPPATPHGNFTTVIPTSARTGDLSSAQDGPPAPPLEDRDFLIEPGSGFSPERRVSEVERRSTREPPRPPTPPPSKPPAAPPSMPSPPPPAGATQANFIAAARRSIQANESTEASSAGLNGPLTEVRSRARAAAAFVEDRVKQAGQAQPRRRAGGVLARAGAFFSTRRRPLMLGLAGIVVVLCALELVRTEASPRTGLVVRTGIVVPNRRASAHTAGNVPLTHGRSAPLSSVAPTISGSARQVGTAPAGSSLFVAPSVDLSPVGSIATPATAPSLAPRPDAAAADNLSAMRELARSGNVAAEFELGLRYVEDSSLPRNLTLAAKWFEKAAEQNNAPAQYRLATLYEKGLGVTQDTLTALDWYRRAATAGNIRAMHNLAVLIAEGTDGRPDYSDAAMWFRKAAEFGVRDSQYNLAILYARGLGVRKDLQQSYIWFALAAAQGDDDAAKKRDVVGSHLDPNQLTQAKAIIDRFTPRKALASANHVVSPVAGWGSLTASPAAKPALDGKPMRGARMSAL